MRKAVRLLPLTRFIMTNIHYLTAPCIGTLESTAEAIHALGMQVNTQNFALLVLFDLHEQHFYCSNNLVITLYTVTLFFRI